MNILLPMAGLGSRFVEKGYSTPKPLLKTYNRKTKTMEPMVLCALSDVPNIESGDNKVIIVDRQNHKNKEIHQLLIERIEKLQIISLDHPTSGQATTCLHAEEYINNEEELFILASDNGMLIDLPKFEMLKNKSDVIVFTFRNDEVVSENPNQYGWVVVDSDSNITSTSIKKALPGNPMLNHAIVGAFWFKKGNQFVKYAKEMINKQDTVNGEYYVDKIIDYFVHKKLNVKAFEIIKYIGWGTPKAYENYSKTITYWKEFLDEENF
jgi:dTDP-glucose pyrophosphorylase